MEEDVVIDFDFELKKILSLKTELPLTLIVIFY